MIRISAIVIVALLAALVASGAVYTVDEREKAIVFKFGQIIRYDDKPGIHFKMPWPINTVQFFDARIQTMDAPPELYLTQEKKNLVVDAFVKWRINDVYKYYTSVQGQRARANSRLAQVVNNGLRTEFGKRTVKEVISGERAAIMDILSKNTNRDSAEYGIEVVDVRLKRVDLVPEISKSVYDRMSAERARVAKELRAQGAEEAEKIRADADRQSKIILAEAFRDAEQLRGEGDAQATALYAKAYGKDTDFYSFYRSLGAYKEAFGSRSDVLLLEPDAEFFKYFKKPQP